MRELRLQEIEEVSGGWDCWSDPATATAWGGGLGAIYGAATGGSIGWCAAAGGGVFMAGAGGFSIGKFLYDNVPQLHYEYWAY